MSGRRMLVLVSAALVAGSAIALATQAPTPAQAMKARQDAMEQVGDSMKALGAIAKKQAPFDAAVVKKNATTIADKLGEAASLFPPGSDKGETHAKPEIWANKADFDKIMKDGRDAAVALAAVSDEAAFPKALGALGANCKACHDKYRLPEH